MESINQILEKELADYSITAEDLAQHRFGHDWAKRVAQLLKSLKRPIHQKIARAIFGKNFFGTEEWSSLYGVSFTEEQLLKADEFPWPEHILNAPCPFYKGKKVKETHFAFLGLDSINDKPRTIQEWSILYPKLFFPYTSNGKKKYKGQKFFNNTTCEFRWYLMLLKIVPDSVDKVYQEQVAMLGSNYEVPLVIEEISKNILFHKKSNAYLVPKKEVRCRDMVQHSESSFYSGLSTRVNIAFPTAFGFIISDSPNDGSTCFLGIAASHKLPPV